MSLIRDAFNVPLEGHAFSVILPPIHLDMLSCHSQLERKNKELIWICSDITIQY